MPAVRKGGDALLGPGLALGHAVQGGDGGGGQAGPRLVSVPGLRILASLPGLLYPPLLICSVDTSLMQARSAQAAPAPELTDLLWMALLCLQVEAEDSPAGRTAARAKQILADMEAPHLVSPARTL